MSEAPARPRLVAPGKLDVVVLDGGVGVIEVGPLADIAPSVPQQEDLPRMALVPTAAVSTLPWAGLDLTIHGAVKAQLDRVRWVLVDRVGAEAAREAGHAALEVEGGIAGARWLPPAGPARRYIAPDPALWTQILGEEPDPDTAARWAETGTLQDRIVLALSEHAVSLRDLELARWAADLTQAALDHEEALLIELDAHAAVHEEEIHGLLEALATDADEVDVPLYGRARRIIDPAFTLQTGDGITVDGPPIEVPASVIWLVDDVQSWAPSTALSHRVATFEAWHERIAEQRRKGKRRELVVWGAIGLLLVLGLLVGLLGQMAMSQVQPGGPEVTDTDPSSP